MTKEISSVANKLREVFPKGVKAPKDKTKTSTIGDEGQFGHSLTQNDPETIRFIKKHKINDHGDRDDSGAFKVATSYSLDNEKNSRLKGHGKKKEADVYEDTGGTCPHCGKQVSKCKCKDKSQGEPAYQKDKALLLGGSGKKLREHTLSNELAMEILEALKAQRITEMENPYGSKKPEIGGGGGGGASAPKGYRGGSNLPLSMQDNPGARLSDPAPKITNRDRGDPKRSIVGPQQFEGGKLTKAVKKLDISKDVGGKQFTKGMKAEEVKLCNKQDTHDTEFTKGMEVNKHAEGEIQTMRQPSGPASNKSKKLDKRDTKKPTLSNESSFKEGAQSDPMIQTETLSSKASAGDYVDDFVHSKNKMFSGDSKKKRIDRALGAYYSKKHESVVNELLNPYTTNKPDIGGGGGGAGLFDTRIAKAGRNVDRTDRWNARAQEKAQAQQPQDNNPPVKEDFAEPLLGEGGKSKKKKTRTEGGSSEHATLGAPSDRTQNLKADTGFQLEGGKRSPGTEKRLKLTKALAKKQIHFGQVDEGHIL